MKEESTGPATLYGKRMLDPEAYRAQQDQVQRTSREGTVYGRRTLESQAPPPPPPPANPGEGAGEPEGPELLPLAKLHASLTENPAGLDDAMKAEFRADRPRKGALRIFRELEEQRAGGSRADVLALLDAYADGDKGTAPAE